MYSIHGAHNTILHTWQTIMLSTSFTWDTLLLLKNLLSNKTRLWKRRKFIEVMPFILYVTKSFLYVGHIRSLFFYQSYPLSSLSHCVCVNYHSHTDTRKMEYVLHMINCMRIHKLLIMKPKTIMCSGFGWEEKSPKQWIH